MKVTEITHPDYDTQESLWEKYRLTFEGGWRFIDKYLTRFSTRETELDYTERKTVTYCPAHAKAAIIKIKNAIYQRMSDIIREGGPISYQEGVVGNDGMGVDRKGSSMNNFIGTSVLPELLSMGAVGVFVDKPKKVLNATLKDKTRPYMYIYAVEDIKSYTYDENNILTAILLQEHKLTTDIDSGLVIDREDCYRLATLTSNGVRIQFFSADGTENFEDEVLLDLKEIPFVFFKLTNSLLIDVADYQVALLNLASSDMSYALKSNFPFYTEQYNPQTDNNFNLPIKMVDVVEGTESQVGTSAAANTARDNEIKVGTTSGRRYPKGLERPGFIHPSSEPLTASIVKQEKLQKEIQDLVNLSLANVNVNRESTKSREYDNQGLEAGLSYIGMVLELGEQMIAKIWAGYEKSKELPVIKYPTKYSLLTDEERITNGKSLQEEMVKLPSKTYQKEIAKRIIDIMLSNKVSFDNLKKMHDEIDNAVVIAIDPEVIQKDHEGGLVSTETASLARGYAKGEVEQAKKDHAERAARIALAQSKAGARGVADMSASDDAKEEKDNSQSSDNNPDGGKAVRGEGK